MNEFLVECPKCKREALVTAGSPRKNNATLMCHNCPHAEHERDLIRYKSTVKRNCDHCGKEFKVVVTDQKEKVKDVTIPCPHCGTVRTYSATTEKYRKGYESIGQATDPIFGLPLWFQADVRGDLFWAFNREHLNEIKAYVISRLRERQSPTHTTMVEKLPHFIKDAKNRDRVVKVIERLQQKTGG